MGGGKLRGILRQRRDALSREVVRAARRRAAALRLGNPRPASLRRSGHGPGHRQGVFAGVAGRRRSYPYDRRRGGAPARIFFHGALTGTYRRAGRQTPFGGASPMRCLLVLLVVSLAGCSEAAKLP